jgi:8-oxo-dGTP diphosphatase
MRGFYVMAGLAARPVSVQRAAGRPTVPDIVNAVMLRDDRVLLARRSAARRAYPNLWSFPGGHVEAGESLEQALYRELAEEIGVVPVDYRPIAPIADPHAASTVYRMFAITRWTGEPTILDEEHSELRWVDLRAASGLSDLALDAYRPMFEALARP